MRSRPTILALFVALSVANSARAEPPRPDQYQPAERPEGEQSRFEKPLFVAGAVTFLTSYGLGFGVGALTLNDENKGLYVPLAGPWIALAQNHPCEGDCEHRARNDALLVLDGIAQAGGAAMMATSLIQDYQKKQREPGAHVSIMGRTVGVTYNF